MYFKLSATFIIFLAALSCNMNNANDSKVMSKGETASEADTAATTKYYQFNSALNVAENFTAGYADTFSVALNQFRLTASMESRGELVIQHYQNGLWINELNISPGMDRIHHHTDYNLDGFNDLTTPLLRGNEVYLYDSTKNTYHPTPLYFAFHWLLLDSAKGIYYNNYSNSYYWKTNLFSIKNFAQVTHYEANIDIDISEGKEIATLSLFRIRNNNPANTEKISELKWDMLKEEFDVERFWRKFLTKGRSED